MEIPTYVIEDLGTIWKTLTSGCAIDPDKFGKFCDNFVKKFQKDKRVNFYLFSPTIHKGPNHLLHSNHIFIKT